MKRPMQVVAALIALVIFAALASTASATKLPGSSPGPKSPYNDDSGSLLAPIDASGDTYEGPGNNNDEVGHHDKGRTNTFVNDPCVDPPPPDRARTVQSETEIAVFGKYMAAGWNDSWGFYDRTQGLSGFGYSTDGGNTWIDGGGLPPRVKTQTPAFTGDTYSGDPVLVVDKHDRVFTKDSLGNTLPQPIRQPAGQFYYNSIYFNGAYFTLSVNRGRFMEAPPTTPETTSDTRCQGKPELQGIADPPENVKERLVWEPPVEAVMPPYLGAGNEDFLDKNWMHVDQRTGTVYVTYTRFTAAGETPIELVRSYDGGRTWTPPTVIVPNEAADFNQATYVITVPLAGGGTRVIVYWWARTFELAPPFPITDRRIEYAVSNDDGNTFGPEQILDTVGSTGEPPGYNRRRIEILNAPFAFARGNTVAVTYVNGKGVPLTGAIPGPRPSDIISRVSHDGGLTYGPRVVVNDDPGVNSHVFPSVQIDKHGYIYIAWVDRRNDAENILTETWTNVSRDGGVTYGHDKLQSDVATSWFVRADARPNFGDYNSSELIDDNIFVTIWADGRFPGPVTSRCALGTGVNCPQGDPGPQNTPDTIFGVAQGLGVGTDPNASR